VLSEFGGPLARPTSESIAPFLKRLVDEVHPLALGNVHRVHPQIKQLAKNLLLYHADSQEGLDSEVESLTTRFCSHLHMIGRNEAREILGDGKVEFMGDQLDDALDQVLHTYEATFGLRRPFLLASELGDQPYKEVRFIGGAIETGSRSYLYETTAVRFRAQWNQGVREYKML
jgi:hypothetical protein